MTHFFIFLPTFVWCSTAACHRRHRLQQLPHGEDIAVDHGLFQLVEVRRQRVTEVVPGVALGELPFLERNGEDII